MIRLQSIGSSLIKTLKQRKSNAPIFAGLGLIIAVGLSIILALQPTGGNPGYPITNTTHRTKPVVTTLSQTSPSIDAATVLPTAPSIPVAPIHTNNTKPVPQTAIVKPTPPPVMPTPTYPTLTPAISISSDGCTIIGTGPAGFALVTGSYLTGHHGGEGSYILPASGTLTETVGGPAGDTAFGEIIDPSSGKVLTSAFRLITNPSCGIAAESTGPWYPMPPSAN